MGGEPTCGRCGHRFLATEPRPSRSPLASLAGARDRLQHATRDLFRLSQHSIPASAAPPDIATSATPSPGESVAIQTEQTEPQSSQSSMMFSLEELMKSGASEGAGSSQTVDGGLWEMQAATPLFGTAQDQALLTTPIAQPKPPPSVIEMPSRPPPRRLPSPALAAGGGAALLLAGLAWWMSSGSTPDQPLARPRATASASRAAAAVVTPVAVNTTPAPPAETPPAVAEAPEEPSADAPGEAAPALAEPAPAKVEKSVAPEKRAAPAKPKKKKKKKKLAGFNKSAAKRALISAAGRASSCRKAGGPGGKGKVQLTFTPSGRVSGARIVAGPMAGTAAGQCALRYFKSARVPAFSGSAVTVKKSFKIR